LPVTEEVARPVEIGLQSIVMVTVWQDQRQLLQSQMGQSKVATTGFR
jgi:hypothetical protein